MSNSSGETIPGDSTQFVFGFDITNRIPSQTQVLQVSNRGSAGVALPLRPSGHTG
jgi:hypothetical protein